MLSKLDVTDNFIKQLDTSMNIFSSKNLPSYNLKEPFSNFSAFHEYQGRVINSIECKSDDFLSHMIRIIYFDDTGYTGTQM